MSKALWITRFTIIILAAIVAGCSIYLLVRLGAYSGNWTVWTPLIVSILSIILYASSVNPKVNVSPARNVFAFAIAVAWFVSPSYRMHQIVLLAYYSTSYYVSFFSIWNCGTTICSVLMTMDICGLLAGVLSLLEIGLAIQAWRSSTTTASNKTPVPAPPGGEQQYIPLQQPPQQQYQPPQQQYQPPQQQYQPPQQQFAQQPYYQSATAQEYYAQGPPPTATTSYPQTY